MFPDTDKFMAWIAASITLAIVVDTYSDELRDRARDLHQRYRDDLERLEEIHEDEAREDEREELAARIAQTLDDIDALNAYDAQLKEPDTWPMHETLQWAPARNLQAKNTAETIKGISYQACPETQRADPKAARISGPK